MNAALDTAADSRATFHPGVEKHHGFGDPDSAKAQQPRPIRTAAFFMPNAIPRAIKNNS